MGASGEDLTRAVSRKPREAYTGKGAANIRRVLNGHLMRGPLNTPRIAACEDFSLAELEEVAQTLLCHRDDKLLAHYTDDARSPRHAAHDSLKLEFEAARQLVSEHPKASDVLRHGLCHELVMQWVHHLSTHGRSKLRENSSFVLPLLPEKDVDTEMALLPIEVATQVSMRLEKQVTCQIGHAAKKEKRGVWEGFPHWPYEVTYNASGYGPYPFWTLGGGSGGALSGPGTDIQTWWSAVENAERLDHASCNMAGVGYKDGVPCTHLFLDGDWAFLFSKDEEFCCMSSANKTYDKCHMSRPQRDFMDVFKYDGVINYTQEDGLHSGQARKYSMHLSKPSNFWFWYITDMNDRPIEQGEGPCNMFASDGSRNCDGPPKMLFHQYHPDTFKNVTLDPAVFRLPSKCQEQPRKFCEVQPTLFCGDSSAGEASVQSVLV